MKYHVELYCEQTLTTVVEGPEGMSEDEARDIALEKADAGEAEFVCDVAHTTYWPLNSPMDLRAARHLLERPVRS